MAKKLRDVEALGITIEEYDQRKKEAKKSSKISNSTKPGGLTEDGRRRISESLKLRWQDEEYRKKYIMAPGRNVTAETREKISKAIKLKWQDMEYRTKCMSTTVTLEARQRISNTLKEKWRTDEEFKTRMRNTNLTHPKTDAWKAAVSQKIKDRWNDPEYRNKIAKSNRTRPFSDSDPSSKLSTPRKKKTSSSESSQTKASIQASREKTARSVQSKTQQIASKLLREAQKSSKEDVYAAAKRECRLLGTLGMQMTSTRTVREMLGEEFWAEEKAQRSATAKGGVIDDMSLELTLISEWSREVIPSVSDNPVKVVDDSNKFLTSEQNQQQKELSSDDDENESDESEDEGVSKLPVSNNNKKTKATTTTKQVVENVDEESADTLIDVDDEDEGEGDYVIEYMGH